MTARLVRRTLRRLVRFEAVRLPMPPVATGQAR
jgi:hypothetical protein